jgi:ubiquinol-cytochrome c reductase cytochrome b subunit
MKIGGLHPEEPFVLLGQICTFIYFAWFLLVIPMVSFIQQLLYSDKFKTGNST